MAIDLDFIRAQLRRRSDERQLTAVARGAGVNVRTLSYILAGRGGHMDTLSKLQTYLKATARKKKLEDLNNDKGNK